MMLAENTADQLNLAIQRQSTEVTDSNLK